MVPEYKKIRLRFSKLGPLKFISHLDLDRTMKSVITRSGLKIEYTHGYNPRPHLVFSLPAALGIESECEFLDIKVDSAAPDEVKERLNAALPPDLRVIEAYEPQSDFKEIETSSYVITLISPDITEKTPEQIKKLFEQPVIVEKRTKKSETGTAPFDIAPYVKIRSCEHDGEKLIINADASASNSVYINPEYIIKAISAYLNINVTDPQTSLYTVLRTGVYFKNGSQFR